MQNMIIASVQIVEHNVVTKDRHVKWKTMFKKKNIKTKNKDFSIPPSFIPVLNTSRWTL